MTTPTHRQRSQARDRWERGVATRLTTPMIISGYSVPVRDARGSADRAGTRR